MTAASNANTSGLVELIQSRIGQDFEGECHLTEGEARQVISALVTAASAQARIAELKAASDVLKIEVIGLRAAIFGSHDYDPTLRHGNFIEMARATEDGRQGAINRATAAEARADRLAGALERQGNNMAFVLNHANVGNWYDKFTAELAEDRTTLKGADQ